MNKVFISLVFLTILFGAITNQAFIAMIIFVVFSIITINVEKRENRACNLLKIYLSLLVFQNILIGVGGVINQLLFHSENLSFQVLTQAPTTFIVLTALYYFVTKEISYKGMDFWGYLLIGLIAVSFVTTPVSFMSKIGYARNFILFYIIYVVGRTIIKSKFEFDSLLKFFIGLVTFVVFFGLIGSMFFDETIWKNIFGVQYAYAAKGLTLDGNLPSMWRTYLFGLDLPRMVSTYMEPVNLSYLLASGFLISLFSTWTTNKLLKITISVLIGIGTVLTVGKGGILLALIGISIYIGYCILTKLKFIKLSSNNIYYLVLVVLLLGISGFSVFYYIFVGDSARPHFWGIINGFNKIMEHPFGYGLGSGGNLANIFGVVNHAEWLNTGSESALISIGYQLGIQGVLLFVILLILMSKQLFTIYNLTKDNLVFILSVSVYGIIIVSVFQENTLSPQCISSLMLFSGAVQYQLKSNIKVGLVGSSGGHLTQLFLLESTWKQYERFWVTFDKEDSRSLLENEKKYWCYFPTNRNVKNLIKNTFLAFKIICLERPTILVSTGAAVSIPFFYIGKLFGVKLIYIEVYDRIDSPTISGKVVYPICDYFILQWEEQQKFYPKGKVIGGII